MSLIENDYLDKLLIEVEKIADVDSVYVTPSGTYEVVYNEVIPGLEEIEQINTVLANWPLNKYRFDLIAKAEDEYENTLQQGFVIPSGALSSDTAGGWSLPLETESIAVLSMQLLLATDENSSVDVTDIDGVTHTLPVSDMRSLLNNVGSQAVAIRRQRVENIGNINNTYNSYLNTHNSYLSTINSIMGRNIIP